MKTALLPVLGLTLGLAAGTAWRVVTWDPPSTDTPAETEVVASDSLDSGGEPDPVVRDTAGALADADTVEEIGSSTAPAPETAPDSGAMAEPSEPLHGTGRQTTTESSTVTGADAASTPGTRPESDPAITTSATTPVASSNDDPATGPVLEARAVDGVEQLARIFAAMQARDAAQVLEHMSDAEVRSILTRVGARQAASILSNMNADRAAVLSRAVLGGGAR
jgi:hypothetical protein